MAQSSGFIVDYAERQRYGERVARGLVESAVRQVLAKRLVKRPQMAVDPERRAPALQARTRVLNEDWETYFRQHYPGFRPLPAELLPMAP